MGLLQQARQAETAVLARLPAASLGYIWYNDSNVWLGAPVDPRRTADR